MRLDRSLLCEGQDRMKKRGLPGGYSLHNLNSHGNGRIMLPLGKCCIEGETGM